jgi:hypothetical protein
MAYSPRNSGYNPQAKASVSQGTGGVKSNSNDAVKKDALFTTGIFAPHPQSKGKAIATVQLKEAVTIPAGSYINLYECEERKTDKSPLFRMQVREGVLKSGK